ncbi:MAG: hypothetical protein AAGA55_00515 [Planctomycetota bacterium]
MPDDRPIQRTGSGAGAVSIRAVESFARTLDAAGARIRVLLVIRAVAIVTSASLLAALTIGLLDFGLRLPAPIRGLLLLGGIAGVVYATRRWVLPALRWRIGRAAMAYRLERIFPEHAGGIAPAVDLLSAAREPGEPGAIARSGIARTSDRIKGLRAATLIRHAGIAPGVAWLGLMVATLGIMGLTAPTMTAIGAQRVLTPWSDAHWPTRFGIENLTGVGIHPIDEALPIRAAVGPGDPRASVRIEWRTDGSAGVQRATMTPQPLGVSGQRLYERLIDPAAVIREDEPEVERVLSYRITSPDDQTGWETVRLVRPPEVVAATANVTPPVHAAGAPGLANFRTGTIELPTGEATISPLLGGSTVEIIWSFSSEVEPVETEAWSEQEIQVKRLDGNRVRVSVPPGPPTRIRPLVSDRHGLGVRLPVSLALDTRPDSAPSVQIATPGADQVVTPDAIMTTRVEGADEVGIVLISLEARRLTPPAGSAGAPPQQNGEPVILAATSDGDPIVTRGELEATVSPGALGAVPGDEIVLHGIASDTRGDEGTVRSQARRLRVVSQEDFAARLRSSLDPVAGVLRRSDDDQRALIERNNDAARDPDAIAREQTALRDTVAAAQDAARRLARDARINRLDDAALNALLGDLDRTLQEAVDAAGRAARLTEAQQQRDAVSAQREVRERLGEAISMLDRGNDAYLARRAVSRVREQLEEARASTALVAQRTAGLAEDEIAPADREELERLGQSQRELANRAREALEELGRRADALERDDPAQAQALRRAAETGRAGDVASQIERGGEQTEQNRTGQAGQSQEDALRQLDEMLEQIDSAASLRDTALRRKLADLIRSIESLIAAQERSLNDLQAAGASGDTRGLAAGMITLRNNTLGVIEDASAALAELRLIAEALRDAQDAQSDAISALRLAPPDIGSAEVSERRSLSLLLQALDEAKRQDEQAEQREQERRKQELRGAYREALQAQAAIRDDAAPLVGRSLTRRERIESRRLSGGQRELASSVEAIRAGTEELAEAPVFGLAHDQLDLLMRSAAEGLAASAPPASVRLDQEQAVALLASLVEVLDDQTPPSDEEFQEGSGGDGGGGSGEGEQPLIPPVAELRLLRQMQGAAMVMTRRISEDAALRSDPDRTGRLADLQRSLAERGTALIERMNRPPGPPPADPARPSETEAETEDAVGQPSEPDERTESGERIEPVGGSADEGP